MLTLKDCLDYCGLTEDEIHLIAEHEHLPEIIAAEFGSMLLHTTNGMRIIQRYIQDNIKEAESRGQARKAERLHEVLGQFKGRSSKPSANGRD
jgi:hypothetical protein